MICANCVHICVQKIKTTTRRLCIVARVLVLFFHKFSHFWCFSWAIKSFLITVVCSDFKKNHNLIHNLELYFYDYEFPCINIAFFKVAGLNCVLLHFINIVSASEANMTTPCEMEFFNFLWLIWDHYIPLAPT